MLTHLDNAFASFEAAYHAAVTFRANLALGIDFRGEPPKKIICCDDDEAVSDDDLQFVPETEEDHCNIDLR